MDKLSWKPWHEVLSLRDDLRSGDLPLNLFAADLYEVLMQRGVHPIYERPEEFFALTYPTFNLRKLVRDVVLRLAGKNDKAVRQLELTYGGGKTHTLITLRHLVNDPETLPDLPAVGEFIQEIGQKPPKCRVVGLCFDKLDVEKGLEVAAPDGTLRWLKQPWSVLAFQLAGNAGLSLIHADNLPEERATPPAENLMTGLLSLPEKDGLGTLVLIDEVLMYARQKITQDKAWRGILQDFFQCLTQAAAKTTRCCIVASLLASDPAKNDAIGMALQVDLSDIFQRQREDIVEPVVKEDVAEVLKRRFFTAESLRSSHDEFRQHVVAALKGITALDEQTRLKESDEENRYIRSYPFHPDLTEVLYSKWTAISAFQRTRGVLRTFALALRAAESWDTNPLVGPAVFLSAPGQQGLSEALGELVTVANSDVVDGKRQSWTGILDHELSAAGDIQAESARLKGRELEQAVIATFLHSQPQGNSAHRRDLLVLIAASRPDKIELEKALGRWSQASYWLDDRDASDEPGKLPENWKLGTRPNLNQMHATMRRNVQDSLVQHRLLQEISATKQLVAGATASGATVHILPERPRDIQDNGAFHYAVLELNAASESGKPSEPALRFLTETTGSDHPRVYRNSLVLLVPTRDGVEAAKARVVDYIAWEKVRDQIKEQQRDGDVDAARLQSLTQHITISRGKVPEAIRQAYCIIVTIGENDEAQAFRIAVSDESHFLVAKADKRTRIREAPITAGALLPDGPYNLWRSGETWRRVKDLAGAFAQYPHLPKMIRSDAILGTLIDGCERGSFVLRLPRPDGSQRSWWMTRPDEVSVKDSALELVLPENAELADIDPALLSPDRLPELWHSGETSYGKLLSYFDGTTTITVARGDYSETIHVPKAGGAVLEMAVANAVDKGLVWLVSGPTSLLAEKVPLGIIAQNSLLRSPPEPIAPPRLLPGVIPEAWNDGKTSALSLLLHLSKASPMPLPWKTVRDAIGAALNAHFLEIADSSQTWPCQLAAAQFVHFKLPSTSPLPKADQPEIRPNTFMAEATLEGAQIQDLGDIVNDLLELRTKYSTKISFHLQVELGDGKTQPPAEAVQKMNTILKGVSGDLQLG